MSNLAITALADAIADRLNSTAPPPLLDAKEAGELLNLPSSWLLAEARANRIPHIRFTKYVRFRRDDLLAWADGRTSGRG